MHFTTPEGRMAFFVILVVMTIIVLPLFYNFVYKQFKFVMNQRRQEKRARQKRLDRQNNVGRRIANGLREQIKRIGGTRTGEKLELESFEPSDSVTNFFVGVRAIDGTTSRMVFDVKVFAEFSYLGDDPVIMVEHRHRFREIWRIDDEDVKVLIYDLQRYINHKFGHSRAEPEKPK